MNTKTDQHKVEAILANIDAGVAMGVAKAKALSSDPWWELTKGLSLYLDELKITSDNIGDIRRSLMMPWNCHWNSIVRDETATRENLK